MTAKSAFCILVGIQAIQFASSEPILLLFLMNHKMQTTFVHRKIIPRALGSQTDIAVFTVEVAIAVTSLLFLLMHLKRGLYLLLKGVMPCIVAPQKK